MASLRAGPAPTSGGRARAHPADGDGARRSPARGPHLPPGRRRFSYRRRGLQWISRFRARRLSRGWGSRLWNSPGEAVGIAENQVAGKTVTRSPFFGWSPRRRPRLWAAEISLQGGPAGRAARPSAADSRNRIAYVFQDPLTTLNPLIRVGEQSPRACAPSRVPSAPERCGGDQADGICEHRPTPRRAPTPIRMSFRAPAPTHFHRHGARQRPEVIVGR